MSQTREALEALIRWVMRDVTYHKHYGATVMGQIGTELEVMPDDKSIAGAGLSKVKILYGLPGVTARVLPGTRVTLFFENGDPKKPRVHSWEGGHVEISFANGAMPVARVGDMVSVAGVVVGDGTAVGYITGGAPTVKA